MGKLFDSVKMRAPRKNKFDMSHERKFSFNMGFLTPILVQEIVPGDSFQVNTEIMMRLAPMLAPIMHRVNVKTEYFFVPNRLVWDEFEDFITGGRLGTSAPVMPNFKMSDWVSYGGYNRTEIGSLGDYMGLPNVPYIPDVSADVNFSALPFRAYQLIYDEYYRDQNLTASLDIPKTSGNIPAGAELNMLGIMRKRAWEKDYFTSALPFAQRGPQVDVPLVDDPTIQTSVYQTGNAGAPFSEAGDMTIGATGKVLMTGSATQDGGVHVGADGHGINIISLRRSVRLQEWLEKAAQVGSRYTEILKGFFGVRPADARLQRPEFLGGATTPIQISEVLSTLQQYDPVTDNPVGNPQGDMTGRGMSFGNVNGFRKFFQEHGYVIGLVSVLPRTAYQQGLPKHFSRFDKLDYYWEQFAHIGEQAVLNQELYYDGLVGTSPGGTFGYQSRYSEMKYGCSSVHGDFRASLEYWHMGRIFAAQPDLNTSFIEADPTHRIFAVDDPTQHKLWCQLYHKINALRPMPYFGTPSL